MTRTLCIDPGMRATGYAVIEAGRVLLCGALVAQPRKGDSQHQRDYRRVQFYEERLSELITEHEPEIGVVESYGSARSATAMRAMATAWTLATTLVHAWQLTSLQVTPFESKKALGLASRGTAKRDVIRRVRELHPEATRQLVEPEGVAEHVADAIALYHGAQLRYGGLVFQGATGELHA